MNTKRNNKKIKKIYIALIIIVIIIGGIINIISKNNKSNFLRGILKDGIVQTEKIISRPFHGLNKTISDLISLRNVLEENKILKSNIDKVEILETENAELKSQIAKLKSELNVEHVLSDYEYINATVINRNTLYWYNNLTIDKGTKSGIKNNMVVMNSTGLIGKITNASAYSAEIKLITTNDTNNKISVTILNGNNKLTGVINGYDYDKGHLKVEGISNTETVTIGDKVYTSGLGGIFPSGVLIGTVENITTDVYDLSKIINVKPSANFKDINYVTILKRKGTK